MKTLDIYEELKGNAYPGRGIIIGKSEDGKSAVTAYFIMGRSVNSRNRVFTETEDGIKTEAADHDACPSAVSALLIQILDSLLHGLILCILILLCLLEIGRRLLELLGLLLNLIMQSSVLFPYLFLVCGSVAVSGLIELIRRKNAVNEIWQIIVCYAGIITVCIYAGILTTQASHFPRRRRVSSYLLRFFRSRLMTDRSGCMRSCWARRSGIWQHPVY